MTARPWSPAATFAALLLCAPLALSACGQARNESVALQFQGMKDQLADVEQTPDRTAVEQVLDDCMRDAREGRITTFEAAMFKPRFKTVIKDGRIGETEFLDLQAEYQAMIAE